MGTLQNIQVHPPLRQLNDFLFLLTFKVHVALAELSLLGKLSPSSQAQGASLQYTSPYLISLPPP